MLKQLLIKGLSVFVAALLSVGFVSEVQAQEVTGTVTTAEDGLPLPGVNIRIQGTDSGTVTDMDGEYSLDVPSLNSTLIFSYVGFQSQTVALNGRDEVDIALTALALEGDELIVTAFGIEREARSLSYSTQNVNTETLAAARESNVMASFAGRVGGMSVTQAGSGVGAPTRVILRGNRSISGDSQPLYIVDGVPASIDGISPDMIASVEVLKGPNAAALYGSAAQNGAIVISTNRAQAGVVNVSLSNNFTMSQANILREFQNVYGQGAGGTYNPGSEFSWGPEMTGQQVPHWTNDPNHPNFGQTYAYEAQPDNVSDVFRVGYNNASNLTASVGGETTQTVFSYTYTTAQGIFPGNDLERNNVNLRITSELSDRLTLDSRLTYMREIIDNQLAQGEGFANPTRNTYRLPRNVRTADVSQFEFTDAAGANKQHYWAPGSNGGNNPYWVLNRNLSEDAEDRTMALASLDYEITDYLNFMVRGAYNYRSGASETKRYNDSYVIADNGYFAQNQSWGLSLNTDFLLAYQQDLTDDWALSANLGGNVQQNRNESVSVNTSSNPGMTIPNFFAISNTQSPQASHSIGGPRDVRSLYAFGQIGWRDAIYLDITGRNDWSSTLPEENNSYFYPSVGLTTVLSDLIEMPEAVSLARLRLSYAQVGSSASPFQLNRTASLAAGGNAGFLSLSGTLPNSDLKPELTESYEIGADVRFFQGRLGLDVTAYQTNTTNQLFTVALPIGSGASQFYTNGGNIENKGLEFTLNTTPVERMGLIWDVDFTFGMNRNKVVEISDERPRLSIGSDFMRIVYIEEGEPFGNVYSRGYQRDSEGNVLINAATGLPLVTNDRSVLVANYEPDWTGGISSNIAYGNWNMSFLIDHRQGGTVASMSDAISYADGVAIQTLPGRDGSLVFGENFMTHENAVLADANGDPTTTANNVAMSAESFWRHVGGRNAPVGEAFVDSATNTRLRELTLGYRLPESVISTLPVSNVTVSLVGRNLFFIHRASENLDPDLMVGTGPSAEGFESFAPPTTRTFGANIRVDF